MPLQPGIVLGQHQILSSLGAGGMGEVYRGRDTKLHREVAIKVLPEAMERDGELLARLEREARVLASLNHPNIATLYSFESHGRISFLVMELVAGETLAERIRRGPIPLEEAIPLFRQIVAGLEEAHGKGVIHRDLKPSNIKVSEQGTIKLLDFGLAKLLRQERSVGDDLSAAYTFVAPLTRPASILGTWPYMSPEQASGCTVDERTDIWALGCCFYEVLTGRRAFSAASRGELLAKIQGEDPDWQALRAVAPERVVDLIASCLQKQSRDRIHHVADVRVAMRTWTNREVASPPTEKLPAGSRSWRAASLLGAGAVLAAVLVALSLFSERQPKRESSSRPTMLTIVPPPDVHLNPDLAGSLALSPDGRTVVFSAFNESQDPMLYARRLDDFASRVMPGTSGASGPFFSLDGTWVAFQAGGRLKKVPLGGGAPVTICDTPTFSGGAWLNDAEIVFTDDSHLLKVPARGGKPEIVATADLARSEYFRGPVALPGSDYVLVTAASQSSGRIVAFSLENGTRTDLIEGDYPFVRYAASGHLLHSDRGSLFATPFLARSLKITGRRMMVGEGLESVGGLGALFDVSRDGTLAYVARHAPPSPARQLLWRDREGRVDPVITDHRWFSAPRLSPDGSRLAVTVIENNRDYDVWLYELEDGTGQKLTFEGNNDNAVWSPDGRQIAFVSFRDGPPAFYTKPVAGGEATVVPEADAVRSSYTVRYASEWSPDGRFLLVHNLDHETLWDIMAMPLDGSSQPVPIASTPANEFGARLSPDGEWVAYVSDESSREEVYVQPYPPTGAKWQVSDGGGLFPIWAPGGDEILYRRSGGELVSVVVRLEGGFATGRTQVLFRGRSSYSPGLVRRPVAELDVGPSAKRFLTVEAAGSARSQWDISLVLGWLAEPGEQALTAPRFL